MCPTMKLEKLRSLVFVRLLLPTLYERKTMLNVRRDICAGCGACTRVCPTDAISLYAGKAQIDQSLCTECYLCVQACPRGAIIAVEAGLKPAAIPSVQELRNNFLRLQTEVQMLSRRLKNLEQRKTIQRS